MEIIIHMDTKKIDTHYMEAIAEYVKRTSPFCKISIKTYKNFSKLNMSKSSTKYIVTQGENSVTSEELSALIQRLNLNGVSCIEFIVTNQSPDFFDLDLKIFNISSFSMSIDLTSVVLTEQLYRAYTILNNITYHK